MTLFDNSKKDVVNLFDDGKDADLMISPLDLFHDAIVIKSRFPNDKVQDQDPLLKEEIL